MLISKKKRLVFLHIPKTAGSSVSEILRRDYKAVEGKSHDNRMPKKYHHYFIFSIVRNPFRRVYSHFWTARPLPDAHKTANLGYSFTEYLDQLEANYQTRLESKFRGSQWTFLSGCRRFPDMVLRFEQLEEELERLPFDLNLSGAWKRKGEYTREDFKLAMSDKSTVNRCRTLAGEDFERFDYPVDPVW